MVLICCLQPDFGWVGNSVDLEATGDAELAAQLHPELKRFVRDQPIIGMTVVATVGEHETIIGLGRKDLNAHGPPDKDTLYEIGSISKTFAGTLPAHASDFAPTPDHSHIGFSAEG